MWRQIYTTLKCSLGHTMGQISVVMLLPSLHPPLPRPSLLVTALASRFPTAASCQLIPCSLPLLPPTPMGPLATLIFSSQLGMIQHQLVQLLLNYPRCVSQYVPRYFLLSTLLANVPGNESVCHEASGYSISIGTSLRLLPDIL